MIFEANFEKNFKNETDYIYKQVKRKKPAYCGHCNKNILPNHYAIVYYFIVSVDEDVYMYDKQPKMYLHYIRSVGISCTDQNCINEYLKKINTNNNQNYKPIKPNKK